jgi:hypothetical protein
MKILMLSLPYNNFMTLVAGYKKPLQPYNHRSSADTVFSKGVLFINLSLDIGSFVDSTGRKHE